jgi:hypothetical protein
VGLWGLRKEATKVNQGSRAALEIDAGTYWGEQDLYLPSVRSLHEEVRLIVGKLHRWKVTVISGGLVWRPRPTHVEHLPCDPDGVTAAEEVFDTRGIDARGSESVGHLDAEVAAKAECQSRTMRESRRHASHVTYDM